MATVRLPADGIAQDTRAVCSAIPAALDDIVDEPDIPGIEELFEVFELLADVAEPHAAALTTTPAVRKLSDSSRRIPPACIERPPERELPRALDYNAPSRAFANLHMRDPH